MHAVLVVLALVSAPAQPESKVISVEQARLELQGTWSFVEAEERGKKLPADKDNKGVGQIKWVFRGDKLALRKDGKGDEFGYSVDPAKTPREINLTIKFGGDEPIAALGIYKLEGKTLTICLGDKEGTTRPAEFKTEAGSKFAIIVLRKE